MKTNKISILEGFNKIDVFKLEDKGEIILISEKMDWYKILLIKECRSDSIDTSNHSCSRGLLIFIKPNVSFCLEELEENKRGFLCCFAQNFFSESAQLKLHSLPMYQEDKLIYIIDKIQDEQITDIFARMHLEMDSKYQFKYDLLRNYIIELTHFVLKRL